MAHLRQVSRHYRAFFAIAFAIAALAPLASGTVADATSSSRAKLSVSPNAVVRGQRIRIRGTGYPAMSRGVLTVGKDVVGTIRTGWYGTFSGVVATPQLSSGTYRVTATAGHVSSSYSIHIGHHWGQQASATTTTTAPPTTTTTTTTTTTSPPAQPLVVSSGQPDATNTGPVGPLTSMSSSAANAIVAQNNGVLANASVDGCLQVRGANVTIRNTKITCDGAHDSPAVGTPYPPAAGTLTIDHSQLSGYDNGDPNNCGASLVSYQAYTLTASNLFGCADGIDATNRGPIVIEGNWVHDLWFAHFADGSVTHNDGFQSMGTENAANTVLMEGNTIDADGGTTSAVMFGEEFGVLPIATVTGNWMSDSTGSYTFYSGLACQSTGNNPGNCVSGVRITASGNHLGKATYGIWHIANSSLINHSCNTDLGGVAVDQC